MLTRKKAILIMTIIIILVSIFSGCSNNNTKTLTVWSHLSDKEVIAIRKVADKWGAENGYKVNVHSDKGDNKAFLAAVKDGSGPDIEFGIPHSLLEKLYSEKVLDKVPENKIDKNLFISSAVDTVSFSKNMYALPLSISTYALYYNTDKISTPPKTFDELLELGLKYGFQYDINNIYLSYSVLAANGAYVFKNSNNKYDVLDRGLNNEGAIKGYEMLRDMVTKYKLMPMGIDSISARKNFKMGKTGFYLSGPWDIEELNKENDDKTTPIAKFAVAELPSLNGKAMPSFVSVKTAFVSSKSNSKDKAWDLLSYLVENTQIPIYNINGSIPVIKDKLNDDVINKNSDIKQFVRQIENGGVAIPNVTETQVLQSTAKVLSQLTTGVISPQECGIQIDKLFSDFIKKASQKK